MQVVGQRADAQCCGYGMRLMFKGREFKSWHHILDGHFFTYLFVVKFVMLFEKTKINKKRLGLAHLFKEVAGQKSS